MYNIISVMLYSYVVQYLYYLFYPISASHSFPLKENFNNKNNKIIANLQERT